MSESKFETMSSCVDNYQQNDAVFDEIEKNDGFNLTRLERDKAINNCIEYTKTLFKLDNVELMESFLKTSLKA